MPRELIGARPSKVCELCGIGAGTTDFTQDDRVTHKEVYTHDQTELIEYMGHKVCESCMEWMQRTPRWQKKLKQLQKDQLGY